MTRSSFLLHELISGLSIMWVWGLCEEIYAAPLLFVAGRRYYGDFDLHGDILLPCHLHAMQHPAEGHDVSKAPHCREPPTLQSPAEYRAMTAQYEANLEHHASAQHLGLRVALMYKQFQAA